METTRERFGRNVAEIRTSRGITVRELSARTEELGHRIAPSSISKIESGVGAADPDQIIILALVLQTTPNRLLLTGHSRLDVHIDLTSKFTTTEERAWLWAAGRLPLAPIAQEGEVPWRALDDFIRYSMPEEERAAQQVRVRAAEQVVAEAEAAARQAARRVHQASDALMAAAKDDFAVSSGSEADATKLAGMLGGQVHDTRIAQAKAAEQLVEAKTRLDLIRAYEEPFRWAAGSDEWFDPTRVIRVDTDRHGNVKNVQMKSPPRKQVDGGDDREDRQ